jgi:hypothetical protein
MSARKATFWLSFGGSMHIKLNKSREIIRVLSSGHVLTTLEIAIATEDTPLRTAALLRLLAREGEIERVTPGAKPQDWRIVSDEKEND